MWRWITDWRNGLVIVATISAAVLIGLLAATVVDNIAGRRDSDEQLRLSRAAATRRIDRLNDKIDDLIDEVAAAVIDVGKARAEISALQEQVRQLGGRPVVLTSPTAPPAERSTTTTTTHRQAPAPPGTTATTAPPGRRTCVADICIGG